MISAAIFSYKNKNLKKVVDELISNTKNSIEIFVYDQNNLDRSETFLDFPYKDKVIYEHVYWDSIKSPTHYKGKTAYETPSEYFLFLSDDTVVTKHWDEKLINFLKNKKAVVSGMGKLLLEKKDLFFFKQSRSSSVDFTESGFIDRNFVFGKTKYLKDVIPQDIKYNGEEELMSLFLYNNKIKVFSAPSKFYEDLELRTITEKYVPFSLNHNYNLAIKEYKKAPEDFLSFTGIKSDELFELPYQTNDVSYDPSNLFYQDIDARKFLEGIKGIF
jgi:hypothetical protein